MGSCTQCTCGHSMRRSIKSEIMCAMRIWSQDVTFYKKGDHMRNAYMITVWDVLYKLWPYAQGVYDHSMRRSIKICDHMRNALMITLLIERLILWSYAHCAYDHIYLSSRLNYFYSSSIVLELSYAHCAYHHISYRMLHTVITCALRIWSHLL